MKNFFTIAIALMFGYTAFVPNVLAAPLTPWSDGARPVIQINNDALMTQTKNVKLQISITNATEMIISNEAGFAHAQWQDYRKEIDWEIWSEYGYVQVFVMFRNAYGTSATFSDGIYFQSTISTNRRSYAEWLAIAEGRANFDGTSTQKPGGISESFLEADTTLPTGIKPGDLIKTKNSSTIYYIGLDHLRHVIPTVKEYDSWFQTFLAVKEVPATTLSKIDLGKNLTVRPGTYLIKMKTGNKVYAVDEAGKLRWIKDEQLATALFGYNWSKRIITIEQTVFSNYEIGSPISEYKYIDGMIVRKGDEVYKTSYGKLTRLSPDGYLYNDFQDRFTVKYSSAMNMDYNIDEIKGWVPQSLPKISLLPVKK